MTIYETSHHGIHISIYTWYMTHHVICLECVWYMSGICFPSQLVICLVYVRDIPDICFPSHLGICQGYTRHMTLFVKCPGPAAAAMQFDRSAYSFQVSLGFNLNVTGTVQRAPPRPLLPVVAGGLLGGAAAAAAAAPPRPAAAQPRPAAAPPRPPAFLLPFT
jgi:hypothetical protein